MITSLKVTAESNMCKCLNLSDTPAGNRFEFKYSSFNLRRFYFEISKVATDEATGMDTATLPKIFRVR
jgi:hypothetical protein